MNGIITTSTAHELILRGSLTETGVVQTSRIVKISRGVAEELCDAKNFEDLLKQLGRENGLARIDAATVKTTTTDLTTLDLNRV